MANALLHTTRYRVSPHFVSPRASQYGGFRYTPAFGQALTSFSKKSGQSGVQEMIRINKLMAQRKLCSRREADMYLQSGWVFADGRKITMLGSKVSSTAQIEIRKPPDTPVKISLILNKPCGFVSAQAEHGHLPAASLLTANNRVPGSFDEQFASLDSLNLRHRKKLAVI